MTEAEAERLAAAEGLVLVLADTAAGYKGVPSSSSSSNRPFKAKNWHFYVVNGSCCCCCKWLLQNNEHTEATLELLDRIG